MPDKPSWDTSIEGKSPILAADPSNEHSTIVTDDAEIQAERIRRAGIQAQELAHATMRTGSATFLAGAQNRETANRLNVEQYPQLAEDLARALYQQGKFAEALTYATGEQADYIVRLQEAVDKDDDADCGCPREVVEGMTLCRRFERESIFSPRHNQVVTVKECSRCGDLNAYAGLPERQTKIAVLRALSPLADDAQILKQV